MESQAILRKSLAHKRKSLENLGFSRAIDGARTRGLDLGKVARYQLRHYRIYYCLHKTFIVYTILRNLSTVSVKFYHDFVTNSFYPAKRVMGIEPTYPAWKAGVLPLNYTRIN